MSREILLVVVLLGAPMLLGLRQLTTRVDELTREARRR